MYLIKKVLNNNCLLADVDGSETIFLGKGIGFGKKVNEFFEPTDDIKQYKMETKVKEKRIPQDIIANVDPVYIEIASEIIYEAKKQFDEVDTKILLPLADHIDFAIKRMKENAYMKNPFTQDIQLLFPDEYQVALVGRDLIKERIGIDITDDEVGYISLHVHSAITNEHVLESIQAMEVIQNSINQLRQDLRVEINVNSISYMRLMNHIKYLLLRLHTKEKLQIDIGEFAKDKFPFAYEQAQTMCQQLSKVLNKVVPETEVGYLALHLERILSFEIK